MSNDAETPGVESACAASGTTTTDATSAWSGLRVLYGYSYFQSAGYPNIERWQQSYFSLLRQRGFSVDGFCLTLNPPGPRLSWSELDRRWKWGDRELLAMYERLEEAVADHDVFVNGPGINLHPRFVEKLPIYTVYQCFDDPESSEDLSKPVAAVYDLCLVGNVAELETYRRWGVKRAEWQPMGLLPGAYPEQLTEDVILEGERDVDLVMFADRLSPPRRTRMDELARAFPTAHFYGSGWPRGCLALGDQQLDLLRRAKIGPNIHNSTGPINFRMFQLPANGVMQICDNKSYLSTVFDVGREVIGFDSIRECVDLCRYYLTHDQERREIAAAGWRRTMKDYSEAAVFRRLLEFVAADATYGSSSRASRRDIAHSHRRGTAIFQPALTIGTQALNAAKRIKKHISTFKLPSARKHSPRGISRHEQNFGVHLGEWTSRAQTAWDLIRDLPLSDGAILADFGCGRQSLRKQLPTTWVYLPFDYISRSPDTIVFDLNRELPSGRFDISVCLGVLEYLDEPLTLLRHLILNSNWLIFSYCGPCEPERRLREGWKSSLSFAEIEQVARDAGGERHQLAYVDDLQQLSVWRGRQVNESGRGAIESLQVRNCS